VSRHMSTENDLYVCPVCGADLDEPGIRLMIIQSLAEKCVTVGIVRVSVTCVCGQILEAEIGASLQTDSEVFSVSPQCRVL